MTTVDFWAAPIDRSGDRISLGNGLFGPATTAFHRLVDLIRSGRIEGTADDASARARIPGSLLREILTGLGEDGGAMVVTRQGHTDEASLQADLNILCRGAPSQFLDKEILKIPLGDEFLRCHRSSLVRSVTDNVRNETPTDYDRVGYGNQVVIQRTKPPEQSGWGARRVQNRVRRRYCAEACAGWEGCADRILSALART